MVGTGPGPFTGLRVGMVTAAALGDALDDPGARRLLARRDRRGGRRDPAVDGPLLVVTDARRREVYWAAYDAAGARSTGPHVETPAALAARLPELGVTAAAGCLRGRVSACRWSRPRRPVRPGWSPAPWTRCAPARGPGPLEPLYLRRPDAVAPGPRKPAPVAPVTGAGVTTCAPRRAW